MKIKIFGGILAAALATASLAQAQTHTPVINIRQHKQERRINKGVRSGELTKNEAHHLRADERNIRRDKRMAKADGKVTRAERRHLRKEQNNASHAISRPKKKNLFGRRCQHSTVSCQKFFCD